MKKKPSTTQLMFLLNGDDEEQAEMLINSIIESEPNSEITLRLILRTQDMPQQKSDNELIMSGVGHELKNQFMDFFGKQLSTTTVSIIINDL